MRSIWPAIRATSQTATPSCRPPLGGASSPACSWTSTVRFASSPARCMLSFVLPASAPVPTTAAPYSGALVCRQHPAWRRRAALHALPQPPVSSLRRVLRRGWGHVCASPGTAGDHSSPACRLVCPPTCLPAAGCSHGPPPLSPSLPLQVCKFAGPRRGADAGKWLGVFIDTADPRHGLSPDPAVSAALVAARRPVALAGTCRCFPARL